MHKYLCYEMSGYKTTTPALLSIYITTVTSELKVMSPRSTSVGIYYNIHIDNFFLEKLRDVFPLSVITFIGEHIIK